MGGTSRMSWTPLHNVRTARGAAMATRSVCIQKMPGASRTCMERRKATRRCASTIQASEDPAALQIVALEAAQAGAQVVRHALDRPRNIEFKGTTDLVTETDRQSEAAILAVLQNKCPHHAILGEEGGLYDGGDPSAEILWCIDPLDGTTNFAHSYPSFAVSVGAVHKGKAVAACVVEFTGGPHCWTTRTFLASRGNGASCNGYPIQVTKNDSVQTGLFVTGFGYIHDEAWSTSIDLFKHFTDHSRGVRRLGAAAVDMCHVALGLVDGYWEYCLKPWDMAAGSLILEEAGGKVTTMDGRPFEVYERSILATNGALHDPLLKETKYATEVLIEGGYDFSQWFRPEKM
mmetsp:Transcript_4872/g.31162  ORF Transcript_4872/g.31162 Transcript_4872/m.31162 type:complete len:346 (+) Transcript_4872:2660-3697(+)